jgi:peptidoglycan/LPS O-acetylase OafA/YrhL
VVASGRENNRVNELDLLRFFAALAVVFHHYSLDGFAINSQTIMPYPFLASISKYGYLGVDLFFMISGFVILMTASDGSLKKFVISRLVRLYPAFWVCCTITFLATLAIGASEYSATFGQYLVNMTMLSGFMNVESIDSVYWSLFIELKFYAFIAIVLLAGRIQQVEWLFIVWLIITIALVIYPIWPLRFFLLEGYSANFIAGAAFFFIWSTGITRARYLMVAAAWCCAVYQSTSEVHEFEARIRNDLNPYIIAAIVSGFFAVMASIAFKQTGAIARANWVWFGVLTYPLYLIHQSLGFMLYNALYDELNPRVLFWELVIGMILLAYLIHILVEKPLAKSMRNALNKLTVN